ncbi:GNAT family N-acetyltransferase [Seongchinamella unica]|nr:GNAT family N-acetyltransferase [Seongchinamella unica]
MEIEELIRKARDTDLPAGLVQPLEAFIAASTALLPVYPAEFSYRVKFGQRVLLREVLEPDQHDNHWWETGLHIIRQGVAAEPALESEYGPLLGQLGTALTAQLGPYESVTLSEISAKTVTGICLLSELMTYPQSSFVAPNAYSLAEAMFNDAAWFRAIYAGKAPVGFIMLEDDTDKQAYYLWRFMIAPQFQKRGYGAQAIALLIEYVQTRPGAKELLLGYIDHPQGPAEFYRRQGFTETGKVEGGEVEMRLAL